MESVTFTKDFRDKKVLNLHNEGKSIRDIKKETGLGVATIHKILSGLIIKGDSPKKEVVIKVDLTGNEEKITSFSGLKRTDVNEYVDEKTGEVIRVVFVKAESADEFGYFVRVD